MKSVNSILNSIIAVLLIGGIYTLTAVTGETSPIEETGIAYETTTEATTVATTATTTENVTSLTETVTAAAPSKNVVYVTESTAKNEETESTTETEETPESETTTTTTATTTTITTTSEAATITTQDVLAAAELYEEDEEPEDTGLYEEDEPNENASDEDDILIDDEYTDANNEDGLPLQEVDEPEGTVIEPDDTVTATVTVPKKDIQWNLADGEPAGTPDDTSANTVLPPPGTAATTLTAYFNGKRQTVDAFGLICAVTSNEVSDSFEDEAIKAQAVAAYSYIKEANDRGDAPDVAVDYNYSDRLKNIVTSVWGIACYHNGKLAQTVYSASSAGYTASSESVWGGAHPYLVSVETPFDAASDPNYGIKSTYTENEMRSLLESKLHINLSGNPANWLIVTGFTDGNYVETMLIDGQDEISGREFRESVMNYKIRSSAFAVSYYDGIFTITTYGYGHGVGMSQNGANILAKQGYNYVQILKYYYTGVEVR
ncbi:MAG: SpoIID/LytB domain-containing protein [Ruminococcus sp.]|jgi:stage II sporulation protein D|nr:SpoIID/LytB domain-containing protein [Ruminococcus sp.]